MRGATEAELSAFGEYVYRLDSTALTSTYKSFVSTEDSAVVAHYAQAADSVDVALWHTRLGLSEAADSLLAFLRTTLPANGLDTTAFLLPDIARDMEMVHTLTFDSLGEDINVVLPRLDYNLTRAYVRTATGLRYGFMRPDRFMNRQDYKTSGGYARLFDYSLETPSAAAAMNALLSPGRMDYLCASEPDDPVSVKLREALAQTTDSTQRRTLAVNMERLRWRRLRKVSDSLIAIDNSQLSERRVFVNIPALQLWAIGGDSVLNMKICCGATATKTPLLTSEIRYMQVNPDWIVPTNIIKSDITRHAGDSAYFARNRYYIVNMSSGDTLNAASVTREALRRGGLRVGQRGGSGNSLGRIVFRFPNSFSVYLHDTNNRSAFSRERRTLSHGCVRVEKPFDLARFLLRNADEWTLERLRISMDIRPETDRGRKYLREHASDARPLRLMTYSDVRPVVPLAIEYYTAYPNPKSGKVEFWPDLYGYDKLIQKCLYIVK